MIAKAIFLTFTIWLLTALLNGLLSGTWLVFYSVEFNEWTIGCFSVFIATLFFSIPGTFILWLVFLVNSKEEYLFRSLLKAGFIVSSLSSAFIFVLPLGLGKREFLMVFLLAILSLTTAIMIHHAAIRTKTSHKTIENYA